MGYTGWRSDVIHEGAGLEQLAEWYRQYAPLVHARARRLLGDEADDVVQEVFVRLLDDRPKPDRLLPWMYTTSTNLCLDRLRHRKRRDASWQSQVQETFAGQPPSLEEILASRDLCQRILTQLPPATQTVVVLVYLDGMTQEQAAEVLGVSRKTVNERLQKFLDEARARWAI